MSNGIIHKNRNGCALHGALKAVTSIDGFVPVIHSSAGCSIQSVQSENIFAGSVGKHYRGWLETPSTSVIEKQVVFGGTSRLREQIKNTVKVQKGDLYVVITGCAPEIVGDDVPAMVKEAQEQGFPVISVSTPGFKGNVYRGYVWVLKSIIEQVALAHTSPEAEKGLVNILGIVPKQDLFWEGNLDELEYSLSLLGLQTNKLFGFQQDLNSWRRSANGSLNVVVSPWGLEAAILLEKKFGTPYLYFGYIPVGANDTTDFLFQVGQKLGLEESSFVENLKRSQKRVQYEFQKIAQSYFKFDFQKEIVMIGEASNVIGLSRFLYSEFGQLVQAVVVTDAPNEEQQAQIESRFGENIPYKIFFETDSLEIDSLLEKLHPELILGSELEENISQQLRIPLLRISSPVFRKPFLNYSYAGYRGVAHLLQDFAEVIFNHLTNPKLPEQEQPSVSIVNNEIETVSAN